MTDAFEIAVVDHLDCRLEPKAWDFAVERAGEIEAHWQRTIAERPAIFNGQVLLQHSGELIGNGMSTTYRSRYLQADYKSFLAWRDLGRPDGMVRNCFSMAALETADGAFIAGEMAAHTANAGRVYFAAGTPEPADMRGRAIDLADSARRELQEETGLGAGDVGFEPGWTLVLGRHQVACMKRVRSPLAAADLVSQIHAFLGSQRRSELSRMHILRTLADLDGPEVAPFMRPYLAWALDRRQLG